MRVVLGMIVVLGLLFEDQANAARRNKAVVTEPQPDGYSIQCEHGIEQNCRNPDEIRMQNAIMAPMMVWFEKRKGAKEDVRRFFLTPSGMELGKRTHRSKLVKVAGTGVQFSVSVDGGVTWNQAVCKKPSRRKPLVCEHMIEVGDLSKRQPVLLRLVQWRGVRARAFRFMYATPDAK